MREIVTDLEADQPLRRVQEANAWEKIEVLLGKLRAIFGAESEGAAPGDAPMQPFTIILNDPAGDSFIEFVGSMADAQWNMRTYSRSMQDDIDLGMVADDGGDGGVDHDQTENGGGENADEEVYIFPGVCSSCKHPLDTKMKKVSVPYFKVHHSVP